MHDDDATPTVAPASVRPRWVRAADALTVVLAVLALQAAVFGGFQIPGLSVRNPWRPLAMAVALGGLRLLLVHGRFLYERLRHFSRRLRHLEGRSSDASRQFADAGFLRVFDVLVVWVVSVSYASIVLLTLDAYEAGTAVILGLVVTTVVVSFTPARFDAERDGRRRSIAPVLLLVLFVALLFRAVPFRTMHGGQDQGVYVAMSGHLQREGSVFIDDPLPDALPDHQSRAIYAAGAASDPVADAAAQPGIYYSDTRGDYVFQFYHLHPLWMATFASLFGDGARFHSVTFFGLLSILGLCLLTLELTGSRRAALASGLLLAVNPLHAFFSRFPVTEAVALAFSSVGFYYLARALRGMRDGASPVTTASLVVLATGCVSLVFFVRITGFLYLPVLVPLFGVGVWAMLDRRRIPGRPVVAFCAGVAALYGLSVLYGLIYSPVYARSIYNRTFGNLLGQDWPRVTAGIAVLALAALLAIAWNLRRPLVGRVLTWAADRRWWTWAATALVVAAVFGSLYQGYLVGFTDRYAQDALYARWALVGYGAGIFPQTGAAAWLLYGSPLLVMTLLWGMHRDERSFAVVMLYLFLAVCLASHLVLNIPVVYRHYYYARYLLSEIVPYTIVLAVTLTSLAVPGAFRRLGTFAVLATIPVHAFFAAKQMPVREGVRPHAILEEIAKQVGDGILLLDVEAFGDSSRHARLQTPLSMYFGTRVFPYSGDDLDALLGSFEGLLNANLWLLTNAPTERRELRLVEAFDYYDERMDGARTIPVTVNQRYWPQVLYLYRQPGVCETAQCDLRLDEDRLYPLGNAYVYPQKILGPGWHRVERFHVWSEHDPTLVLSRAWFRADRWPRAVRMEMRAFAATEEHRVTVVARSGAREHAIGFNAGDTGVHEFLVDCPTEGRTCRIGLAIDGVRSPREVYGRRDARELGIALYRIGFRF